MFCRSSLSCLSYTLLRVVAASLVAMAVPVDAAIYNQIEEPFVAVEVNGSPGLDSQYDLGAIGNQLPNYATVYDDFSFGSDVGVTNFSWIGSYEFDGMGDVLANDFTISVYGNKTTGVFGNEPDDSPFYTETISTASLGEGKFFIDGEAFRSYSADISGPLSILGGETYWFSVVANMDWADNSWGIAFSGLGNDRSFQDFQDDQDVPALVRHDDAYDYAFRVTAVPEPEAFAMIGLTGLIVIAYRRKLRLSPLGLPSAI